MPKETDMNKPNINLNILNILPLGEDYEAMPAGDYKEAVEQVIKESDKSGRWGICYRYGAEDMGSLWLALKMAEDNCAILEDLLSDVEDKELERLEYKATALRTAIRTVVVMTIKREVI